MASLRRPDGIELHVEQRGDGPPVVLAPYWNGYPGVYAALFADLERDHRVVTWDARGTGESTRAGPYDMATDCEDLEAVLEHAGGGAIVLSVGNSCNVAVHLAARREDLVERVVAFGAGPFARVDFAGSDAMVASDGVVDALLEMLGRDYRGALRTVLAATNSQMTEDELRDRIAAQTAYCPQEAAAGRVRAWADDDPTQSAAAIGARLWIFSAVGVGGPWLPPAEDRRRMIEALTPDARVEEVMEDAGPISRPDLIAAAIRRVTEPLRTSSRG